MTPEAHNMDDGQVEIFSGKKILFVEDREGIRLLVRSYFKRMGADIVTGVHPDEYHAGMAQKYNLLISDVDDAIKLQEDISGCIERASDFRNKGKKVIFFSGNAENEQKLRQNLGDEWFDTGAFSFVLKGNNDSIQSLFNLTLKKLSDDVSNTVDELLD